MRRERGAPVRALGALQPRRRDHPLRALLHELRHDGAARRRGREAHPLRRALGVSPPSGGGDRAGGWRAHEGNLVVRPLQPDRHRVHRGRSGSDLRAGEAAGPLDHHRRGLPRVHLRRHQAREPHDARGRRGARGAGGLHIEAAQHVRRAGRDAGDEECGRAGRGAQVRAGAAEPTHAGTVGRGGAGPGARLLHT